MAVDVAQERKVENEKRNSLAQSTSFSLGPELDCPLFMTSPVFDETDRPLPKAYNLRFPSIDSKRYYMHSPHRRHYSLTVLETLNVEPHH